MLHSISWTVFLKAILLLTLLYYLVIALLYYPKELKAWLQRRRRTISVLVLFLWSRATLHAQTADGNNGINQANTLVRSYFDAGVQLMYAVGSIIAIVGAIKVYRVWNSDHREDVGKTAANWFGSCVFLVIVATVIKSFFGL